MVGYGLDFGERYRNLPDILQVDDLPALTADPDALVPLLTAAPEVAACRLPVLGGAVTLDDMIEMELTGVRVELPTNQPIVLLRERGGERYLPIWIGAAEAAAIALSLQGVVTPRPMTHDLMKTILEDLSVQVQRIVVTELRDAHVLRHDPAERGGRALRDLVAALRRDRARGADVGADLRAARTCSTEASILIPGDEEEEVEKFREFLDNVSPEDFES